MTNSNYTEYSSAAELFDAAIDSAASNDINFTKEYFIEYAENACDLSVNSELADLVADLAQIELSGEDQHWHKIQKPLSYIKVDSDEISKLNGQVKKFAVACYDNNSIEEMWASITTYSNDIDADDTDMKTWGIDCDGWHLAIQAAFSDKFTLETI